MGYTNTTLVANVARNIEIANGKVATMLPSDANQFIDEAEQIMDSRLSSLYYVPLRQITRDDSDGDSETTFPPPIPYITTRIAAALMVRAVYSRIDSQVSDNAEAHLKDAMDELNDIADGSAVGSRRLAGQTLKAKTPFLNPSAAPLEQSKRGG